MHMRPRLHLQLSVSKLRFRNVWQSSGHAHLASFPTSSSHFSKRGKCLVCSAAHVARPQHQSAKPANCALQSLAAQFHSLAKLTLCSDVSL
eukprot:4497956-Amphidinium_carterae.1